jgi:hypothetical protein
MEKGQGLLRHHHLLLDNLVHHLNQCLNFLPDCPVLLTTLLWRHQISKHILPTVLKIDW